MSSDAKSTLTPQLVIGLFITLMGVLLTLDRLDIVETRTLLPFWPSVLVVVGVAMLLQRRDRSGRFWGWIWTVIGSWTLLNSTGLLHVRIWEMLGPLLLIIIGWTIVRRTMYPDGPTSPPASDVPPVPPVPGSTPGRTGRGFPGVPRSHEGGRVNLIAVMGEAKRASSDHPFRGGEMTAVMGGCVLDLRQATIAPGEEARLNLVGLMAGHEIVVPPGWSVLTDVVPIIGGLDDKRLPSLEPLGDNPPRLRLKGIMVMGGVVLKS